MVGWAYRDSRHVLVGDANLLEGTGSCLSHLDWLVYFLGKIKRGLLTGLMLWVFIISWC